MVNNDFIQKVKDLTDETEIKKAFESSCIDVNNEIDNIIKLDETELTDNELSDVIGGASISNFFSTIKSKRKFSKSWMVLFISFIEYKKYGRVISYDDTQIMSAMKS